MQSRRPMGKIAAGKGTAADGFSGEQGVSLLAQQAANFLEQSAMAKIRAASSKIIAASGKRHPENQLDLISAMEEIGFLLHEMSGKNSSAAAPIPVKNIFSPGLLAFNIACPLYPPDFSAKLAIDLNAKKVELDIIGASDARLSMPISQQSVEDCLQMLAYSMASYQPSAMLQRLIGKGWLRQLGSLCQEFPRSASVGISLANIGSLIEAIAGEFKVPVRAEMLYSQDYLANTLHISGESLLSSAPFNQAGAEQLLAGLRANGKQVSFSDSPLALRENECLVGYGKDEQAYRLYRKSDESGAQVLQLYGPDYSLYAVLAVKEDKTCFLHVAIPQSMPLLWGDASNPRDTPISSIVMPLLILSLNRYDPNLADQVFVSL